MTATPPPPPPGSMPQAPPPQPGGYPPPPAAQQPGGFPPPPAYGQPAQPGAVPPPPPGTQRITVPPVAWLAPVAAVIALVGLFTPWFRPELTGRGLSREAEDAVYAWDDGKIGLLAPILVIAAAFAVVGLLRNKVHRRLSGSEDPVRSGALFLLGAGAVALVLCLIAWFIVTSQYDFGNGLSWDDVEKQAAANGLDLSRGPRIGYFLTIAAGVVSLVAGGLMLAMHKKPEATSPLPPPPPGGPNLQK